MRGKPNQISADQITEFEMRDRRTLLRSVWFSVVPILVGLLASWYTANLLKRKQDELHKIESAKQAVLGEVQRLSAQKMRLEQGVSTVQAQLALLTEQLRPSNGPSSQAYAHKLAVDATKTAWGLVPPQQAWCYQEQNHSEPPGSQYATYCHWSEDRCNEARAASTTATQCAFVTHLDSSGWQPHPDGKMDSWYQAQRASPLPPPFPQNTSAGTHEDKQLAQETSERPPSIDIQLPALPDDLLRSPLVPKRSSSLDNAKVLFHDRKFSDAIRLFRAAAETGDGEAMTYMGVVYQWGEGVPKNANTAKEWYEKGANAGNGLAMNNLGYLYERGLGVPRDYQKAKEWYEKGVAAGDANAMRNLGHLFYQGYGVPVDDRRAREWYERSAISGSVMGMTDFAFMCMRGEGGPPDYQKGREWFEKSGNKDWAEEAAACTAGRPCSFFDLVPKK